MCGAAALFLYGTATGFNERLRNFNGRDLGVLE